MPWAGLGSGGRIDILQGRNGVFSSRKSCCCRWEGAVVFDGSNKSHHISSNDESLLSYPISAFPGHRPHGTLTTEIMCLVHLAAALPALFCHIWFPAFLGSAGWIFSLCLQPPYTCFPSASAFLCPGRADSVMSSEFGSCAAFPFSEFDKYNEFLTFKRRF